MAATGKYRLRSPPALKSAACVQTRDSRAAVGIPASSCSYKTTEGRLESRSPQAFSSPDRTGIAEIQLPAAFALDLRRASLLETVRLRPSNACRVQCSSPNERVGQSPGGSSSEVILIPVSYTHL